MKKVLSIILIVLVYMMFLQPVYAKENVLYLTENDKRIYYESQFDENVFMKHLDMVPGSSFSDELIIKNKAKTNYNLFFKVIPREQSVLADELLDYINMKVFLDDKLLYDGKAKGLDYLDNGINLQNAVRIGEFTKGKVAIMRVEVSLSPEYNNTENNELSYIDWAFYAQYEKEPAAQVVKVPDTYSSWFTTKSVIALIMIITGGIMLCFGAVRIGHNKKMSEN